MNKDQENTLKWVIEMLERLAASNLSANKPTIEDAIRMFQSFMPDGTNYTGIN